MSIALIAALLCTVALLVVICIAGATAVVGEAAAIPEFRRMHVAGISINLAQLVLIIWSLIAISMQLS